MTYEQIYLSILLKLVVFIVGIACVWLLVWLVILGNVTARVIFICLCVAAFFWMAHTTIKLCVEQELRELNRQEMYDALRKQHPTYP